MEIVEKLIEVAKREVFEEAGIEIGELILFDIYSGEDRIITYPNGDICCVTSIVFKTIMYSGEIQNNTEEAFEHRFLIKQAFLIISMNLINDVLLIGLKICNK